MVACEPLIASLRAWNRLGVEYSTLALLVDSRPCFVRLRGYLVCSGVFVFSTAPMGCEKDHIAPQLCQKKKDTEEK